MTNIELISILSKPWANVSDIKKICSCGKDAASNIRNKIELEIKKKGLNLPISKTKLVPMEYVIKYLNINIDYIYSMAEKEKLINS